MHHFLKRSGLLACTALISSVSQADENSTEPVYVLDEYIVSAGPAIRSVDDITNTFTALDEDAIRQENGSTLGEVLDGQPGLHSTSFGAGASRPIIRGFDGPRVRIVESGLGSLDVSDTSPDHAVTVEPLLTDRIEVLRGPSTLLYGSSAIGGVVNVIGKEIPRAPVDAKGYDGAVETRYDTVSRGETYLGYATVGGEEWAIRVTGLTRKAEDYEIPGEAEIHSEDEHHDEHDEDDDHDDDHDEDEHEEEESGDKLEDSFAENDYVSVGGTWFFGERNYFGASFSLYESFYGVPGHEHHHHEDEEDHDDDHDEDEHEEEHGEEEGVAIDLERKRVDLELAIFEPSTLIEAARIRFGYTDYEHLEVEGDEGGTLFERDGWELRAEAAHSEWAFVDSGVFGIQISDTDFSATGEEGAAFGPPTETGSQSIFITEHMHEGAWHYELGGRVEAQQIDAEGEPDYDDIAVSIAGGIIYDLSENDTLALSLQRSQRHPTSTELYANGAHIATSQFEVGDPDLDLETAYGLDLNYRHDSEDWNATVSFFYTYFQDYIFAEDTGLEEDELPVYAYTAVDASFYGFEAELEYLLVNANDLELRVGLISDYVKAENRDDDEDLPRIPPFRVGGKVRLDYGNWAGGLLLRYAFDQNDTAPLETDTDGYTELKLDVTYTFDLGNGVDFDVFARADNLLNEEIRHHTSFIKDRAPQPGRNFTIGGRLNF